ncbi:MAG: 8-amino-7-oxononanoate synthase [Candidatus Omnitrophota bacterium]
MEREIKNFLAERKKKGLLRRLTPVTCLGAGRIRACGQEYINFSSNDYLGLSGHPRLAAAAAGKLSPVVGSSASRLMTGTTTLHHELEEKIAVFKGKPAALVFNSGYQANVGMISALCGKRDCVFSDRLNHASITDGIRLSGAGFFRFRHNDMSHLAALLREKRDRYDRVLIVTETLFSMDGDISPLEEMVRLKEEHRCMMMVDEAHATGIFGRNGSGLVEEKEVTDPIDIVMGTFSKALGGFGAYAAMSRTMRDYMINTCRSFIYSTALPSAVIAADLAAVDIIKTEPYRRETLFENVRRFRSRLREKGIRAEGDSRSQIVPLPIGGNTETMRLSEDLKRKGYWVTPVRPPTVPRGGERLRVSLTSDHAPEVLDRFADDISDSYGRVRKDAS